MSHQDRTPAPIAGPINLGFVRAAFLRAAFLRAAFACAAVVYVPATMADSSSPHEERAVVELFTSQGCSSCPPADAVAGRLREAPDLLVLSFHVNYWDDLGWKDPYSSQASTDRQNAYVRSLREHSMFTPQVIVNGAVSLVGSRESAVQQAVVAAHRAAFPVQVNLDKQADGSFALGLEETGHEGSAPGGPASAGSAGAGSAGGADVWEIRYVKYASTRVRGGENGGRTLETYNNVTHIRRLGPFAPGTIHLPPLNAPDDGVAIIVQAAGMGEVLGAAAY